MLSPALSMAQVGVSVNIAPPELPVYDQPPIPGDGYIWTPGYWAWGDDIQDYYWVPGTWVPAPQPEYLWTPGYWGANGVAFFWHAGYWGPHVGFYGGVNYGYGYGGQGYEGGYWQGGHLYYNRAVNNVGNTQHHQCLQQDRDQQRQRSPASATTAAAAAFAPQPTAANWPRRTSATLRRRRRRASTCRPRAAIRRCAPAANHGAPPIAATPRPGAFSGAGVVQATRGGAVHGAPANAGNAGRGTMSVVACQSRAASSAAESRPAPRPESRPAPRPESRPAPEPRVVRPAAPRDSRGRRPRQERQPAAEERRAHRSRSKPRGAAPAPRPQQPPPGSRTEHPPEHPAAREEDREHH